MQGDAEVGWQGSVSKQIGSRLKRLIIAVIGRVCGNMRGNMTRALFIALLTALRIRRGGALGLGFFSITTGTRITALMMMITGVVAGLGLTLMAGDWRPGSLKAVVGRTEQVTGLPPPGALNALLFPAVAIAVDGAGRGGASGAKTRSLEDGLSKQDVAELVREQLRLAPFQSEPVQAAAAAARDFFPNTLHLTPLLQLAGNRLGSKLRRLGVPTDPESINDFAGVSGGGGGVIVAGAGAGAGALSKAGGASAGLTVEYAWDEKLQQRMERLFQQYGVDYGAFVALDPRSGAVLAAVSFAKSEALKENLILKGSFPAASLFKLVTATAVIEEKHFSQDSVLPINGRHHTLYRQQIFGQATSRWTHFLTLKEAFAQSVNPYFGKLGVYELGQETLRNYAFRFGFNRQIGSDFSFREGQALIPPDVWGLAETASGFTQDTTLSPLQGALMAASVANQGVMMEPYFVKKITAPQGQVLYEAQPEVSARTMKSETAQEVKQLMSETVLHGTSRRSFRGFFSKRKGLAGVGGRLLRSVGSSVGTVVGFKVPVLPSELEVGGKTGSLHGKDPEGKVDWFIGYGLRGPRQIALAVLTIHEKQWTVKSSYLAAEALRFYLDHEPPLAKLSGADEAHE